jgi:hypothetical protein
MVGIDSSLRPAARMVERMCFILWISYGCNCVDFLPNHVLDHAWLHDWLPSIPCRRCARFACASCTSSQS